MIDLAYFGETYTDNVWVHSRGIIPYGMEWVGVIVPELVKQWLNRLWDSLATVPQPRKIKGLELYAPEPAFTRCKTG